MFGSINGSDQQYSTDLLVSTESQFNYRVVANFYRREGPLLGSRAAHCGVFEWPTYALFVAEGPARGADTDPMHDKGIGRPRPLAGRQSISWLLLPDACGGATTDHVYYPDRRSRPVLDQDPNHLICLPYRYPIVIPPSRSVKQETRSAYRGVLLFFGLNGLCNSSRLEPRVTSSA
jgi:hypothetical protein